jgi:5-methylthioadenosine/S-adenosylhomocysteine deaminase
MFEEMRLAALIAKVQAGDACAVTAAEAFTMATLGGARATGLASVTGSLEVGKAADLIAVSLSSPGMQPLFDPVSHFVYAAARSDVTHVWVAGQPRVTDGKLAQSAERAMAELHPRIAAIAERVNAMRT